jgi:hypothetical protein
MYRYTVHIFRPGIKSTTAIPRRGAMKTPRTVIAAFFVVLAVSPALAQTGGINVRILDPAGTRRSTEDDLRVSITSLSTA